MNIEQGNIINPLTVQQLHTGMSVGEVKSLMGTPLLINTFRDDRVDYVYTTMPGGKKMTETYVTLIFRKGYLVQISGNLYSTYLK